MAQVCLVGDDGVNLRYELLSRETARNALATYDLREPFDNTVAVETVSLGAAVALLNDLDWYLVRFATDAFVREPSVSDTEWLSRDLATAIRDDELDPAESDRLLKIYGIVEDDGGTEAPSNDDGDADAATRTADASDEETEPTTEGPPALVEPMYVTRTGPELPDYDLRDVDDTLVVRVTETEFGGERQPR
jgi:hypothetical protein